jgi:hypothetical protein
MMPNNNPKQTKKVKSNSKQTKKDNKEKWKEPKVKWKKGKPNSCFMTTSWPIECHRKHHTRTEQAQCS